MAFIAATSVPHVLGGISIPHHYGSANDFLPLVQKFEQDDLITLLSYFDFVYRIIVFHKAFSETQFKWLCYYGSYVLYCIIGEIEIKIKDGQCTPAAVSSMCTIRNCMRAVAPSNETAVFVNEMINIVNAWIDCAQ